MANAPTIPSLCSLPVQAVGSQLRVHMARQSYYRTYPSELQEVEELRSREAMQTRQEAARRKAEKEEKEEKARRGAQVEALREYQQQKEELGSSIVDEAVRLSELQELSRSATALIEESEPSSGSPPAGTSTEDPLAGVTDDELNRASTAILQAEEDHAGSGGEIYEDATSEGERESGASDGDSDTPTSVVPPEEQLKIQIQNYVRMKQRLDKTRKSRRGKGKSSDEQRRETANAAQAMTAALDEISRLRTRFEFQEDEIERILKEILTELQIKRQFNRNQYQELFGERGKLMTDRI